MALSTSALIALSVASTAVQTFGQIQQGKAAQAAASTQSEIFRRQGVREREIATLNARRIGDEAKQLAGRQRALLGGRGRDISTGSALLLQTDLAESEQFEKELAEAGGETQAIAAEQRAALARAEGRTARQRSILRAGSTLLSGGLRVGEIQGSFG